MSSTLNKVRGPSGGTFSIAEWVHDPLFTTIEFGSSASVDFYGFNFVRGERVSGSPSTSSGERRANERDTNIFKRRALIQDEAFVVHAVTYEAFGLDDATADDSPVVTSAPAPAVSAPNLRRLQMELMFQLFVGGLDKPQIETPFSYIGQSIGAPSFASGDLSAANIGTAGEISAENQRIMKMPLYIGGFGAHAKPGNSQRFYIRLFNAGGGAVTDLDQDIRLRIYLDGLRKRPA